MKDWQELLRKGALSGGIASIVSTAVLSGGGVAENGSGYAPNNAISHWLWGRRAYRQDSPSVRYTVTGYLIHHASATLWATIYELRFGNVAEDRRLLPALAGGAAVAALACFTDFNLTPKRLRPGFEKRLSRRSIFLVYAAFGASLALRGLLASRKPALR